MRKSLFALALLGFAVILNSATASAQTGITLNANTSGEITFGVDGGSLSVGAGGIAGTTTGNGSLLGTDGYYSIAGGPVTLTLVSSLANVFADYDATGTLTFSDTAGPGGTGTLLLQGTLSLVDVAQTFSTGVTDTSLAANITITGGSLMSAGEPYANGEGIGQLTLNLSGLGYLPTSAGGTASLSVGTLNPTALSPTPEVNSMFLFGTGLLGFGGLLRRKFTA